MTIEGVMSKRSDWRRTLPRCILAGDVAVIALTMLSAHSIRFGTNDPRLANAADIPYWLVGWRWLARQVIVRMRQRGRLSRRLVIIGGPA